MPLDAQKQSDKPALVSNEQLKEASKDLLKVPLTEEAKIKLQKEAEMKKKANSDDLEEEEDEDIVQSAEDILEQLNIDGVFKDILAFLREVFKNFLDLSKVQAEPEDYSDDKYEKYTANTRKNVRRYREAANTFYENIWKETTKLMASNLTSENINQLLDAFTQTSKEQWEKNKHKTTETEWQRTEQRIAGFKQSFTEADPTTKQKIVDWIKNGDLTAGMLSKETVDALKNSGDIEPETLQMFDTKQGQPFRQYLPYLILANRQYGVPIPVMIQLMIHEGSWGNPCRKAPGSSAVGLGQMINDTWKAFKPAGGDRFNPLHQTLAMANYLNYLKANKGCSWGMTLAYYNTGEGGASWGNLANYKKLNPGIARFMTSNSPKGYNQAAARYYTQSAQSYFDKIDNNKNQGIA